MSTDPNTIQHTAFIRIVRAVEQGQEPIVDILTKVEQLAGADISKAEDALATFAEQFGSDFGQAALGEAATYGPQIAADLVAGNASQIPALIPVIAQKLADDGIKIAETDAAKDVTQIIGNALRVQGTAAAMVPQTAG